MRTIAKRWTLLILAGVFVLLVLTLAPVGNSIAAAAEDVWQADYYATRDLSGPIIFSETLPGPSLEKDWLWGFGPQNGVPDDQWSARFTTEHTFAGGNVKFMLNSDDGSRMYLDGDLIIDEWHDRAATYYTARVLPIPAGTYMITVEYYEAFGTNKVEARFDPTTDDPSNTDKNYLPPGFVHPPVSLVGNWKAEYYSNRNLEGAITFAETFPGPYLNREWAWGFGPQNGVPDDEWSARFTTCAQLPGGNVKFMLNSDDGSRLYLNGKLIIDEWHDRAATFYTARVLTIPAGQYQVVVEYYDAFGTNRVEARFEPTTDQPAVPDQSFTTQNGCSITQSDQGTQPPSGGAPGSAAGDSNSTNGVVAVPPQGGLNVDANSPGFAWAGSDAWGFGFGGLLDNLYLFTGNSAFSRRMWARWNPNISQAGWWNVYAWIPVHGAATGNARYRVSHGGVESPVIRVNQAATAGNWVLLGKFWFEQGPNQYVYLDDLTFEPDESRWVLFDAVKFSFSGEAQ